MTHEAPLGAAGSRTVAIVDDAGEIRMLYRAQLQTTSDFVVCAEGGDGNDAVAIAREYRPDVMLLDNSMPGMDGIEALPYVLAASPDTVVVILSAVIEDGTADRALALGARGCLIKSLGAGPLPDRLRELLPA